MTGGRCSGDRGDGDVCTSAGVTGALDLGLTFVEQDEGPSLAREVARGLVTYLQRRGNQAQISMFLTAPPPEHRVVRDLAAHIAASPDADLTAPALATRAEISTRHLTRLFEAHLGTTPSKYVRPIRTETAAELLTATELPLATIARRCGFGSTETLRKPSSTTWTPHHRPTAAPTSNTGQPLAGSR